MTIKAAILVLLITVFVARKQIGAAIERKIRQGMNKLGELTWLCIKALGRLALRQVPWQLPARAPAKPVTPKVRATGPQTTRGKLQSKTDATARRNRWMAPESRPLVAVSPECLAGDCVACPSERTCAHDCRHDPAEILRRNRAAWDAQHPEAVPFLPTWRPA